MLGYTHQNNDVFIFFEENELTRLSKGKIQGRYVGNQSFDEIGKLEAVIDEEICTQEMNLISISTQQNQEGRVSMQVAMRQRVYDTLKEKGRYLHHEGYRQVRLLDATKREFSEESLYAELQRICSGK